MATFVFGMNQTLDGFVDHTAFAPGPALFRHFIDSTQAQSGRLYGRRMYEVMRYWDDEDPGWSDDEREFATAWQAKPTWVVTGSLESVGPRARVLDGDVEAAARALKAEQDGEIEVAGPVLAHTLGELGLIDEYRIYLHPVTLGQGVPFFAGPPRPLRLAGHDLVGEGVIRLTYVPT